MVFHYRTFNLFNLLTISCVVTPVNDVFQVFLGDRYGDTCLQDHIPISHFEMFVKIAKDLTVKHSHLLKQLYELDSNAVPPVYSLKVCVAAACITVIGTLLNCIQARVKNKGEKCEKIRLFPLAR